MKDSGIDIIGLIPNEWYTKKLKYLADIKTGSQDTQDAIEDGQYPFYVRSPIVERIDKYVFDGEAVLMAGDGVGAGKVFHYVNGKFGCHQRVYIIHNFKEINGKFLSYYFENLFSVEIEKGSAKSTVDSVRLPMLQNFYICIPKIVEQKLIANFLDDKVRKINNILSDLDKQVEVLNQYKKSLITETVTKGLKTNVKMKDTGIDWFGEIPENWVVKRLKYVISGIADGTHGTFDRVNEGELLLSAKNVFEDGLHIGNNESYISQADYKSIISNGYPKKGDVLLCCVGTVGRSTVYQYEKSIAFQRSVIFLRNNELILPEMINYCLQTDGVLVQEKILINKSAQDGLYQGAVKELYLVFPLDKTIQKEIIEFLDKKCCEIDYAIAGKQQQIKRIENFKKSLIYEYVTGKKRVKGGINIEECV